MTKLPTIAFVLSLFFFSACEDSPKDLSPFMVDLSEFTINNDLLKDGDYVEILGSSGNLTQEHTIDFYNLVVVKSKETGDTINVLVTNFFQSDMNDPNTRFISNTSAIGKLIENATGSVSDLEGLSTSEMKPKTYEKVFYDSEYIQVDVRNYPAVTGNLGKYTIEGDLDQMEANLNDSI